MVFEGIHLKLIKIMYAIKNKKSVTFEESNVTQILPSKKN